jgi:hypothetical protein
MRVKLKAVERGLQEKVAIILEKDAKIEELQAKIEGLKQWLQEKTRDAYESDVTTKTMVETRKL